MQYAFAYFTLLAFPFFASYLFRKYSGPAACAIAVLAGSLFLPEEFGFDLPLIPPLGKDNITFLSVLLAILIHRAREFQAARPGRGLEALIYLLILGNIVTFLTNRDVLFDEGRIVEPVVPYWLIAMLGDDILNLGIPFVVGRAMFRSLDDLETLLRIFASIGVIYAGLVLVEFLLSIPFIQWNVVSYFYGIYPIPNIRWGMAQPIVFVAHGLELATIIAPAAIAVAALAKAKRQVTSFRFRLPRATLNAGLVATLNVAGNLYGLSVALLYSMLKPRALIRVALVFSLFALSYPALRALDLFPAEYLIETAEGFDAERARSFAGRLAEEEYVLARSQFDGRLLFGWGGIERLPAEQLGEFDPVGGEEGGLDGWWILEIAQRGLFGMFIIFALLSIPVVVAWSRSGSVGREWALPLIAGLMFVVGIRTIDLLFNGWWNHLPIFFAGALLGAMSSANSKRSEARTQF